MPRIASAKATSGTVILMDSADATSSGASGDPGLPEARVPAGENGIIKIGKW